MSSLVFSYSLHKGRNLPIIPIGIKGQENWWKTNAYLDSGAFYSIFDVAISELLEIELTEGKKMTAVVGDGSLMPFYLHEVLLQVGKNQFLMNIGFSNKLKIGFNILGLDLFDRYKITFNNKIKTVVLLSQ